MKRELFHYHLPKELIAQDFLKQRDHAKLMVVQNNQIHHTTFMHIIGQLKKCDVLVLNKTKVKKSRIYGKKSGGGYIDLILLRKEGHYWRCKIRSHRIRVGTTFTLENKSTGKVIGQQQEEFLVEIKGKLSKAELPLPAYIKGRKKDLQQYQTVYASGKPKSLAAPTAGLHFTPTLLNKIRKKGCHLAFIDLEISFNTFSPIKEENIEDHKMYQESFSISKKNADIINKRKGRLIIVGTTALRALEAAYDIKQKTIIPQASKTSLYIYPGYHFKNKIDCLITNFHLPESTLLVLVSAFYGREKILQLYQEAIKKRYRFYSLGDAMMLLKESRVASSREQR